MASHSPVIGIPPCARFVCLDPWIQQGTEGSLELAPSLVLDRNTEKQWLETCIRKSPATTSSIRPVLPFPGASSLNRTSTEQERRIWAGNERMRGQLEIVHDAKWAGRWTAGRLPVDCLEMDAVEGKAAIQPP